MSTTSRYNRRDFLKVAAPAAIALTQGIAPAQSMEPQDAQPKYMPVFFNAAEWAFPSIPGLSSSPGRSPLGTPDRNKSGAPALRAWPARRRKSGLVHGMRSIFRRI
jgi:hypothetical protein